MLGFPSVETLQGRIVRLEPLSMAHVPDLLTAATVSREGFSFTDVPADLETMTRYVERALSHQADGDMLAFAVVRHRDGTVLGSTRFCYPEYWRWHGPPATARSKGRPDAAQIGYTWLMPEARRTGANQESKLLMMGMAFESWMLARITFRTDRRNAASREALLALGAQFEGVLRASSPAYDGGIRDSASYSVLAHEWGELHERLDAEVGRHVRG